MAKIIVRPAVLGDAEQIQEFIIDLASYKNARGEVKATIGDIRKSLFSDAGSVHALIALKGNVAVGMAVYFFNYSTWLGRQGLYLEDIYVSTGYRSQGVGTRLMSYLAGIAMQKSCRRMELSVLSWNRQAINMYESMGAEPQEGAISYRWSGDALKNLAQLPLD